MSEKEKYEAALVAVLCEVKEMGLDIDKLEEKVRAGLMGAKMYAPTGAAQKPESINVLQSAIAEAKQLASSTER